MSTTLVPTPTSRLRCGVARADITPPVGIYQRMWGAARHDRATGVHHPLLGDVLVCAPLEGAGSPLVRAMVDMVGLAPAQQNDLRRRLGEAAGVPIERVVVTHSHTHSGGFFTPDRAALPGGELIAGHLERVGAALAEAGRRAVAALQPATITYGTGRCGMAGNRDYWDDAAGIYACGFNPDAPADDTLVVARITAASGDLMATVVHYACHPTTLAWENSLLSPDYVGALRAEVERATHATCLFAQGACGDLGPRHGYVGDPAVADQNGRQVAYAALAALAALETPERDFQYAGPVVSGATLGTWAEVPFDAARVAETARFAGGSYTVDLPLKPRPDPRDLERDLAAWEAQQHAAEAQGEVGAAREARARAERARRWLARLAALPAGDTYPLGYTVHRMGDAYWVTCGGEPYNVLQIALRSRFPGSAVLVSPLAEDMPIAYLLPADRYGRGLYQEEPSSLAPGCLEALTEAIAARMAALGAR